MQGIFQKENTDKALKYGIYRHLPTYEKIIRNLVSFYNKKWIELIKKHRDIKKLDKETLNELISKIYVHEKEVVNGEITQTIDIYYNFIGNTDTLQVFYNL